MLRMVYSRRMRLAVHTEYMEGTWHS